METPSKEKHNYTLEVFIAGGYLIVFYLGCMLCFTIYYLRYRHQSHPEINVFAASLPPTTPTAHIYSDNRKAPEKIIGDNFDNDQYQWEYHDDESTTKIEGGKLLLESLSPNTIAIARCQLCALATLPYFIQADLSTDVATDQSFGIVFNRMNGGNNFYLFEINTEAKKYYLYHHIADSWSLKASGGSALIKSFPTVNTLGVYINQSQVEFYINGKIIDSYNQSGHSFEPGEFAFCADNSGFKLIVDNLIINR